MKKTILLASCFFALLANAQEIEKKATTDSTHTHNSLTFEVMTGFADGNYPYGYGFSPGDKKHVISHFTINNFDLGARYMITPKFGFRANLGYSKYTNSKNSLPYQTNQFNLAIQGVVNAARILDFKQDTRFGLLGHAGIQVASITSKTNEMIDPVLGLIPNADLNKTEYHGGFVAGITPQYRISNKIAVFMDLSTYFNYRQHMNWDGTTSSEPDLYGKTTNLSLGLSFSIGKDNIHGDYALLKSENDQKSEALQNELKTKIEEIEVMLQDTDRDGVVDYLDGEPNTTGGVTVDTKGRSIDVNKNGVPDELEPRNQRNEFNKFDKEGEASFDYIVKQGIVNIFYDTNKDTPNSASANNFFYIINFLKANPTAKVKAIGFSDSTGDEKNNKELAQKRAITTKNFIVKSGISADRIEILGVGVDTSLDTESKVGRQLARRVSFELIKQ